MEAKRLILQTENKSIENVNNEQRTEKKSQDASAYKNVNNE